MMTDILMRLYIFQLLKMSFGDWEMFKVLLISLREHEITSVLHQNEVKPTRPAKHNERRGRKF